MEDVNISGRKIWLVANEASGSNDEAAFDAVVNSCHANGLAIAKRSTFPADPLPTRAMLADAGIETLAVFAGDGTVNAVLGALEGWDGEILVLPGGTMNLLFHRLFGELSLEEVLDAVGRNHTHRLRLGIISSPLGLAFAEAMAGPGTAWSNVREAMRGGNLLEMATEARSAIAETVAGDMVACIAPSAGRPEGYPLLMVAAQNNELRLIAYHAQTAGEVIEQAAAMAARDFRSGPHEVLAHGEEFTLVAPEGGEYGVLLDGEQSQASGPVRFSLTRCEVDLLATRTDG